MSETPRPTISPIDTKAERERYKSQARDDGWTDPDTGEWISLPGTVRPLVRPERYELALDEIDRLRGELRAIAQLNFSGTWREVAEWCRRKAREAL